MNIHEYQAKAILKEFGVPVPRGLPAFSVEDAVRAAQELGGPVWVVKAQIHAGGRGKGGGVKVAKGAEAGKEAVKKIFGMQLVTHQTGPEGKKVQRLLVEQGLDIARELYLGITLDRTTGRQEVRAEKVLRAVLRSSGAVRAADEELPAALPQTVQLARLRGYARGLSGDVDGARVAP